MADKKNTTESGGVEDRITIIVPSFDEAAFEIHRQNMWEKGYRLEHRIVEQKFYRSNEGKELLELFDGKTMIAATFVKE